MMQKVKPYNFALLFIMILSMFYQRAYSVFRALRRATTCVGAYPRIITSIKRAAFRPNSIRPLVAAKPGSNRHSYGSKISPKPRVLKLAMAK